jgi:DMSO/TMAO reductase YedYZ molybdopterin-dependent catalytic subunit
MGIALTAVAASAGALGQVLARGASAAASRASVLLPAARRPLPALPAGVDLGIEGLSPFVTPNRDFYRIDTALLVPQLTVADWRLRVHGMVERELELSYAELLDRPLVEADVTLTCVSNEVGGDLVGNARWLGVRLDEVLAEAGVRPGATQVVSRSSDGWSCGFPTEDALDGRDALIAVGMNGEPLPISHGFPARLVVPGLYGYVSATKWLTEIELTTWDAFDGYWVDRGWAKEAPVKTASRIDVPRGFADLPRGRTAIAGVAWAQGRGIERVEVRIDDEPWVEARLARSAGPTTWRQWVHEWEATPGRHDIAVRATDGTGATQPGERVDPVPDGATGWHSIVVTVDA